MLVYQNLLEAMKTEKVTFLQMGKLLDCQYQTVSSIVNGSTKKGFYYEDAYKIHKTLFEKYNFRWPVSYTHLDVYKRQGIAWIEIY